MPSYSKMDLLAQLKKNQKAWDKNQQEQVAEAVRKNREEAVDKIEAMKAWLADPTEENTKRANNSWYLYTPPTANNRYTRNPFDDAVKFIEEYLGEKVTLTIVQYRRLMEGQLPGS